MEDKDRLRIYNRILDTFNITSSRKFIGLLDIKDGTILTVKVVRFSSFISKEGKTIKTVNLLKIQMESIAL